MTVRGFFGGLFLVIGWLVTVLSGGCSLIVSLISLGNGTPNGFLSLVFLVGGIPFVVGLVLIFIGRLIWGGRKPHNVDSNPYAIPEEMRDREKRHLKENLEKDNPHLDDEE